MVFALGRIEPVPGPPEEPVVLFAADDLRTRVDPLVTTLLELSRRPPFCRDVGIAVMCSFC